MYAVKNLLFKYTVLSLLLKCSIFQRIAILCRLPCLSQQEILESLAIQQNCLHLKRWLCWNMSWKCLAEDDNQGWPHIDAAYEHPSISVANINAAEVPLAEQGRGPTSQSACHKLLLWEKLVSVEICNQRQQKGSGHRQGAFIAHHLPVQKLFDSSW